MLLITVKTNKILITVRINIQHAPEYIRMNNILTIIRKINQEHHEHHQDGKNVRKNHQDSPELIRTKNILNAWSGAS
jgi:hypothetical protein